MCEYKCWSYAVMLWIGLEIVLFLKLSHFNPIVLPKSTISCLFCFIMLTEILDCYNRFFFYKIFFDLIVLLFHYNAQGVLEYYVTDW